MTEHFFRVTDYDLGTTLSSGQTFRWKRTDSGWENVVDGRWVMLHSTDQGIRAQTIAQQGDWKWLAHYLQTDVELSQILATFPVDAPMRAATEACRGLRLLRQDPWECLASFILSSTKQIVQIEQIVASLCDRFGTPIPSPSGTAREFPSPQAIAQAQERDLRDCKMGFRAPYLLQSARLVASGEIDLAQLSRLTAAEARIALMSLPGVGRKIADCVLLFAYGFPTAFPVDVWVMKALRALYFPKRRPSPKRLLHFSETYFGAHSGYAQQYLFHYARIHSRAGLFPKKAQRKPMRPAKFGLIDPQ